MVPIWNHLEKVDDYPYLTVEVGWETEKKKNQIRILNPKKKNWKVKKRNKKNWKRNKVKLKREMKTKVNFVEVNPLLCWNPWPFWKQPPFAFPFLPTSNQNPNPNASHKPKSLTFKSLIAPIFFFFFYICFAFNR